MKKVVVEIKDDLTVKVDFNGFQGDECIKDYEEFAKILRNLGIKAIDTEIIPVRKNKKGFSRP